MKNYKIIIDEVEDLILEFDDFDTMQKNVRILKYIISQIQNKKTVIITEQIKTKL